MFSVSVKSKYGLCAMAELATRYAQGPVQIKVLAIQHNIPQNYLEQLLVDLKRVGLVTSFRGSQGGYRLAKSPDKILISEIIACLEGPSSLCSGHKGCDSLQFFWTGLELKVNQLLEISLQDLILDKQKKEKMVIYSI